MTSSSFHNEIHQEIIRFIMANSESLGQLTYPTREDLNEFLSNRKEK